MEQRMYERPREKLQRYGASFLTTVELVQVVIGSGTAQVSGAKLARQISNLIQRPLPSSLQDLQSIRGVGAAKASQIIAAIELGKRITALKARPVVSVTVERIIQAMKSCRQASAVLYFMDGGQQERMSHTYSIEGSASESVVQAMVKDALELGARSVVIAFGSRRASLQPTIKELDIHKRLKDTFDTLGLRIEALYRANATTAERWRQS